MQNFGTIQAGDSASFQDTITIPNLSGDYCCTARITGDCDGVPVQVEQKITLPVVQPVVDRCKPTYHGLTFFPWSLTEERLNSNTQSVGWFWTAPKTGLISSAAASHRAEASGVDIPGSYSEGNGGYVHYEMWTKGANDAPGVKIGTSARIIGHENQATSSMSSQAPLVRASFNVNYREYAFASPIPVVKGETYLFSVRRQGNGVNDYVSMNGYIMRRAMYCATDDPFFDDCLWHNWIQNNAGAWSRKIPESGSADYRVGIFEVVYTDGEAVGQTHSVESAAWGHSDRLYELDNDESYRLCWNLSSSIQINEVCIGLVPRSNPGIVNYRIVSGGNVLRTGTFNYAGAATVGSYANSGSGLAENDWLLSQGLTKRHDTFPCLTIPSGTVYIEVTTNSGQYEIPMNRDGAKSQYFRGGECSGFPEGYAEVSTNGGSTWQATDQWSNNNNQYMTPAIYVVECV